MREVTGLRCYEERLNKPPMRDRAHGLPATVPSETLLGTGDLLTRIGDAEAKDLGDPAVRVAEALPQDICGTLPRRQCLHQQENRSLNGVLPLGRCFWGRVSVCQFREPRTGAGFSTSPGGLDNVDGQPDGCRPEQRRRVRDDRTICALPTKPGLLDDVFGLARVSDDSAGDPEQSGPGTDEHRRGVVEVTDRRVDRRTRRLPI